MYYKGGHRPADIYVIMQVLIYLAFIFSLFDLGGMGIGYA